MLPSSGTSRNIPTQPVASTGALTRVDFYPRLADRSQHLTNTSRNNSRTPVETTPLKIPVAATVHNQSQLQCTTSRSYSAQHTKTCEKYKISKIVQHTKWNPKMQLKPQNRDLNHKIS
ncbi:putative 2-oxoglutarate/Fe(II)-dependent dioxygenase [Dorcoceras hygrometricum]|uniref:Putative 2-oxoglutarate/Fe(II)-dependent dioxygenase n=1 Tax=Dorcoceras hygrometricum TaxID=472368 RepID=A0A2Z6ZYU5_9LAMI|nr:putative 2-oxoglutarate/Fe(II)-dependent dioxygenase [Dorcoceras hygrometricum]